MAERFILYKGLKLWLFAGQFCFICITPDSKSDEYCSKFCFQIRVSKSIYKYLRCCSDDKYIEYITKSCLNHMNILFKDLIYEI